MANISHGEPGYSVEAYGRPVGGADFQVGVANAQLCQLTADSIQQLSADSLPLIIRCYSKAQDLGVRPGMRGNRVADDDRGGATCFSR